MAKSEKTHNAPSGSGSAQPRHTLKAGLCWAPHPALLRRRRRVPVRPLSRNSHSEEFPLHGEVVQSDCEDGPVNTPLGRGVGVEAAAGGVGGRECLWVPAELAEHGAEVEERARGVFGARGEALDVQGRAEHFQRGAELPGAFVVAPQVVERHGLQPEPHGRVRCERAGLAREKLGFVEELEGLLRRAVLHLRGERGRRWVRTGRLGQTLMALVPALWDSERQPPEVEMRRLRLRQLARSASRRVRGAMAVSLASCRFDAKSFKVHTAANTSLGVQAAANSVPTHYSEVAGWFRDS